ncbi:MAG: hypothetical protein M3Y07_11190 [Acidobacteriota bacterium]|nr:hypothetical protein [Acidobacteriota bacterium]
MAVIVEKVLVFFRVERRGRIEFSDILVFDHRLCSDMLRGALIHLRLDGKEIELSAATATHWKTSISSNYSGPGLGLSTVPPRMIPPEMVVPDQYEI